jgi:glutamyl-tRNA synthetase
VKPFLAARGITDPDETVLRAAIPGIRDRARTLVDAAHDLDFYFRETPELDDKAKQKFLSKDAGARLAEVSRVFAASSDWQATALEETLKKWAETQQLALKDVAQPMRVALTGRSASPPLFEVMAVLGRERSLARLARAVDVAGGA